MSTRKSVARKHVDQKAANYRPTHGIDKFRNRADGILRAVASGGEIRLNTLKELLDLFEAKTDYHVHIEVAVLPSGGALLKTIDNERDAQETIRRLKAKKS